jgi:hypothetical protein
MSFGESPSRLLCIEGGSTNPKREGLGLEFLNRVEEAIEAIERTPLGFGVKIEDARRCPLRQFALAC